MFDHNCSPEKHEEWRKKAVERGDKEAMPCPHCGDTIYRPPLIPEMPKARQRSEDTERYGQKDRVLTAEGEVETKISGREESAADSVTATEKVVENRIEDEDTETATNDAAPAEPVVDSLQRGFINTSGRIGTLKAQNFPVPVVRGANGLIIIPDAQTIYDERGFEPRLPPSLRLQPETPEPLPPTGIPVELCRHNSIPEKCPTCQPLKLYEEWQALTPQERDAQLERIHDAATKEHAARARAQQGGTLADDDRLASERRARAEAAQKLQPVRPYGETPDPRETPRRPLFRPEMPTQNRGESSESFGKRQQIYSDDLLRWQADQDEYERQAADAEQKTTEQQERPRSNGKPKPDFILLREVFKITPQNIVSWLDKIVPVTEIPIENKIKAQTINPETERVPIDPPQAWIEEKERLTSEKKSLEQDLATTRSPKQYNLKRLREESTLSDLLEDPKGRAKNKRELKKEREMLAAKIKECESQIRKIERNIREWRANENNYRMQNIPGTGTFIPAHVEQHFDRKTFKQFITDGKGFARQQRIRVSLIELDEYVKHAADPEARPYQGLGHFENYLIEVAMEADVFQAKGSPEIYEQTKNFPWIFKDNDDQPEQSEDDRRTGLYENDYDPEQKQAILKTGGESEPRLSIQGAGKDRNLSSFRTGRKTGQRFEKPEGGWTNEVDSGNDGDDS
jgi:hypothetical protein